MTGVDTALFEREFIQHFGGKPRLFSAPGRVNLIGEHTDYNDGFVLPMAIDKRTHVAAAPRRDRKVRVRSQAFGEEFEFDLGAPVARAQKGWLDYVEGTARALLDRGVQLAGADLLIQSELPRGAGLASSAALEIAVGYALVALSSGNKPDPRELALAGQAAEHAYAGTLCGVMDQLVSASAHTNAALLIDCRSLETRPIALTLGEASILICDTRVKHQLASSAYNERRAECARGVELLASVLPNIRSLRDVSAADFATHGELLPEVVRRRCRHVIDENQRTLDAAAALERGALAEFGALMTRSHTSLRDDYAVSCVELDVAVDTALACAGVYGSRMTGGGFGGCTVTLVNRAAIPELSEKLRARFQERFASEPRVFVSDACAGAREDAR